MEPCGRTRSSRAGLKPVVLPVSLVISTYDEGPRLRETVDSLLGAAEQPAQIVVVDDGSTDGSADGTWPERVTVWHRPHRGIAVARNHGANVSDQSILVFLDAHCTVENHWLSPLCDALVQFPTALVGPAIDDPRTPGLLGCGATIINPLFEYRWNIVTSSETGFVQIVPGGCLAVRRDLFLATGGFGPFAGFGLEDVDLSLCWHEAGHPVLGVPRSRVRHSFRIQAPYQPEHQHWVENVLRTAFRHLTGDRLRKTIFACAPYPEFVPAIADVLAATLTEPEESQQKNIERVLKGSIAWESDHFNNKF